jgi:hypothetical protein
MAVIRSQRMQRVISFTWTPAQMFVACGSPTQRLRGRRCVALVSCVNHAPPDTYLMQLAAMSTVDLEEILR